MKRIFTICAILSGLLVFSQEAGKVGELLKNEASKREMETLSSSRQGSSNNTSGNSTGFRNPNNSGRRPNTPSYQWNQNYGYAEVFLRIPEQRYFSVELADQMISNSSGKYRFFDLPSGRIPISIYENGYLMYKSYLNTRNNTRLVLDFFTDKGLYLLENYPLQSGYYGFNNWNDLWNNPYGNSGNNGNVNYPNVMDNQTFRQFFTAMKKDSWVDDHKIKYINQNGRHVMFTSEQISFLVKDLTFDKNRVALAKSLFSKCVDKQKYFVVGEAFDFDSSRRDLMDFISKN